jgi:hypothetical protein
MISNKWTTTERGLLQYRVMRSISASAVFLLLSQSAFAAPTLRWIRQIGTTADDSGQNIAVDASGSVFMSGYTKGDLAAQNAGNRDAFVSKFSIDGSTQWVRQYGTNKEDASSGVSADGLGNVFTVGYSVENFNSTDAFVYKYDSAGSLIWSRQFGTDMPDTAEGVSVDRAGNVFVAGYTAGNLVTPISGDDYSDAYLRKYDTFGNVLWTRQLDIAVNEVVAGVSVDRAGDAFIAGTLQGTGGGDAFVVKYNSDGDFEWARRLPSMSISDEAYGVSADGLGNVYIAGGTFETTQPYDEGIFLSKYDGSGNQLWTQRLNTPKVDRAMSVSADGLGNVFIGGETRGDLGGPNAGNSDAFVSKFDATGALQWTHQFGTPPSEVISSIVADAKGNILVTGLTGDYPDHPSAGAYDAFVALLREGTPGDFNADGTVDTADYVVWRKGLDTDYTQAHYDEWRANFGAGASATAASLASTPEPASAITLTTALAAVAILRRRSP